MKTTRHDDGGRQGFRIALVAGLLLGAVPAMAVPTLQLDIGGGTYVGGSTESTVANSDTFDVYALLNPTGESTLSGMYRISAALYPKVAYSTPPPSMGNFTFNGTTYNVAADMAWGRPPEALMADTTLVGTEIPPHEIFDTYFIEFNVVFDANQQCLPYNVQDNPGDPIPAPGSGFYYQGFAVDVSGMDPGYGIHFDLYQVAAGLAGNNGSRVRGDPVSATDLVEFAPFSHDAESTTTRVPDGASTVTLLGLALTGIAIMARRLNG